jgi:hypothetical protein
MEIQRPIFWTPYLRWLNSQSKSQQHTPFQVIMSSSRRRQQPEPAEPPANPSAPATTRRSTCGHLGSTGTTSESTATRSNVAPTNPLTGTFASSFLSKILTPCSRHKSTTAYTTSSSAESIQYSWGCGWLSFHAWHSHTRLILTF